MMPIDMVAGSMLYLGKLPFLHYKSGTTSCQADIVQPAQKNRVKATVYNFSYPRRIAVYFYIAIKFMFTGFRDLNQVCYSVRLLFVITERL